MANPENIENHKFNKLAPSEQREIASKGGKARAEKMKQKKTLKQIGDMIGSLSIQDEKVRELLAKAGIENNDMIRDTGMMFSLAVKAQKGDPRACELLAKIRGQLKEQQSIEVAEVKPLVDLTKRKKNGDNNEND